MAYSIRDMKKLRGGANVRKMVLDDNVSKKIWIPKEHFVYVRTHFHVKAFTTFKSAKWDIIPCFNQEYGQNGKGCPICDEIQKEWAKWRKLPKDAKEEKKKITDKINQMVAEEFWMNAIDVQSDDKKFEAVRFTSSKMEDVLKVLEFCSLEDVVWLYKKCVDGDGKKKSTKYSLNDDTDQPELCAKLKAQLDFFCGRSYEEGGPCDLDKLVRKYDSLDKYMAILHGEDAGDDGEESVPTESPKQKEKESAVEITDEEMSLDDLDSSTPKTDELDLDGAGLDLPDPEPVKMVKVDAEFIKANMKDQNKMKIVYEKLLAEKKVAETKDYKTLVQSVYAVVKSNPIELKESDFDIPF